MYSCVLKNKEGIIFDEGKDFETLRETFKWASNRGRGYATMNEMNFDDTVKKCKCNEFGGTYYLRF